MRVCVKQARRLRKSGQIDVHTDKLTEQRINTWTHGQTDGLGPTCHYRLTGLTFCLSTSDQSSPRVMASWILGFMASWRHGAEEVRGQHCAPPRSDEQQPISAGRPTVCVCV
ncbi:unnamed protein product [Protopolystoma xenopodis]|uniref:Uncharacterized protein n=1 Tax=Protopolystoma xenopodis TaxID=117903 RepID=A0A448X9Q1_9PLAT|nr:unnamed protein product [Protopolystoma xenopodis]